MPLGKAVAWRAPRVIPVHFGTNAAILTAPSGAVFVADQDYSLMSVSEVHEALGTDGGAVTLDVVKCTGTQAAAAGTTMLASTFNLKSTINTVVTKARAAGGLSATSANRLIKKGDRIALNFAGTLTALTGVNVTIVLEPALKRPSW